MTNRAPLHDAQRLWTPFESELFNLITRKADRPVGLFSQRLAIAQSMLTAFDKETERPRRYDA